MSIYEYDKEFEEKKLRKAEFADALEGSPLVIQNFINELKYEKAHSELNL